MEKLHHELWITHAVNVVFGPIAAAILRAFGRDVPAGAQVIPDYIAMLIVIAIALTALSLFVRSRLSVENPGGRCRSPSKTSSPAFQGLLADFVGPKGPNYLPLVASIFVVILLSNLSGLVPGLMAPTTNLNVTLGCAHDGVGLLPLPGLQGAGRRRLPEALRGAARIARASWRR